MARPKKIAIEHKDLGLESEVLEESLPAWESNGWTRVDDGDSGDEELELFFADHDDPADPDADKE
jgi:hypothetical protein